jgi:hypothetical protein
VTTLSTPSRPPPKPIAVFAVQAALLSLLIGWWPTPRALVPALVRAHAAPLINATGSQQVTLRASDGEQGDVDTLMEGFLPGDPTPRWRAELSTLRLGWWPSAVLLALVLATPMTTRRRLLALCAALLWVELYLLLRLTAGAAYAGYEARYGPGEPLTGPLHALLRTGAEVLEANGVLIAVVLIGFVVVARPAGAFDTHSLRRLMPQRSAQR